MASTMNSFIQTFNNKIEAPVRQHLKNVYGCLTLSTLAATSGAYIHLYTEFLKAGLLTSLGGLGLLLALLNTQHNGKNQWLRLSYLLGFAFLSGLGMGPLLEYVIDVNPNVIVTALVGTAVIFVSFTLAALLSRQRKWLYLGGTLISVLNTLILLSLMNIFFKSEIIFQLHLYVGLIAMSGFVIYDTQLIVEKNRMGSNDYIDHSLHFFLDFINIFRHLLIILTQKEQRRNKRKE